MKVSEHQALAIVNLCREHGAYDADLRPAANTPGGSGAALIATIAGHDFRLTHGGTVLPLPTTDRVICPRCHGDEHRVTGNSAGFCFRCRGFGTVLAANLTDTERKQVAS